MWRKGPHQLEINCEIVTCPDNRGKVYLGTRRVIIETEKIDDRNVCAPLLCSRIHHVMNFTVII